MRITSVLCFVAMIFTSNAGFPGLRKISEVERSLEHSHMVKRDINQAPPGQREAGRLPGDLEVEHYDLELRPDIYTGAPPFSFDGSVDIIFICREETQTITLNSVSLTIENDAIDVRILDGDSGGSLEIVSWQLIPDLEFLEIVLNRALVVGGRYQVGISAFSGDLYPPQIGSAMFYDYYPVNGETRYILASQLHAHNARRVFPSFDEPAMKAVFNVTLLRRPHMRALTNAPLLFEEQREAGWVADHFALSPRMSAYLLCFVVCDFPHLDTYTSRGTLVRIWARQQLIEGAAFASSVAGPMLEWFENYTTLPYQISKVDHIALPNKRGAMENWGLITYGETNLLWKEDWFDSNNKRTTSGVIAHELAHMWFGNLVTLDWWDDTWLNEGFASFYESQPAGLTGWQPNELMLNHRVLPMLVTDTRNTTTPVRPPIPGPAQALSAFSSSQYLKGASVLRMIRQVLGQSTFDEGIKRYLRNHSYSTATTDDLWAALTQQAADDGVIDIDGSPLDMKTKFDPWVDQRGFPLLRVSRDYENGRVTFSQEHYNPRAEDYPASPFNYTWNVPITMVTTEQAEPPERAQLWLDRADSITVEEGVPTDEDHWLLVNVDKGSFYRVMYDDRNNDLLARQLRDDREVFSVESRAALINDAYTLARSHHVSELQFFELTRYLCQEVTGLPWLNTESGLVHPVLMLRRYPATFALLQSYLRSIIEHPYTEAGWEIDQSEEIYYTLMRQSLIRLACQHNVPHCLTTASQLFDDWVTNPQPNPIDVDQRSAVYCTAVREGGEAAWDTVHARYLTPGPEHLPYTEQETLALLRSLTCSRDPAVLARFIWMTFDPVQILPQHTSTALNALADSETGRWELWRHLKENWRNNPLPPTVSRFSILLAVVEGFASEQDETEFEDFVSLYPPESPEEEEAYTEARATIAANRAWSADNQQLIHDWLLSVPTSCPAA